MPRIRTCFSLGGKDESTHLGEPWLEHGERYRAVDGLRAAVRQAGNSSPDKRGMWADSTFEDLVQYNDRFHTQLIGIPEQIAERVAAYRKRGVDLILGGFLHFQEEVEYVGSRVLPLCAKASDQKRMPVRTLAGIATTTGALAWVRSRPAQERS
jgi:alkanesulfonate monooxygenase SsuD/methylene tetrahydromethanopterin reductase-like flavin-dependent oxidoreductase (luciferase family)